MASLVLKGVKALALWTSEIDKKNNKQKSDRNMKISVKICLGALACACLVLSARATTIDLSVDPNFPPGSTPYVLGNVNPPEPADPTDYANYINAMIPLALGGQVSVPVSGGSDNVYRSENAFSGLTTATIIGDVLSTGNPTTSILDTGFEYLVGKYDGPNGGLEVWDIAGIAAGTTIDIPENAYGAGNGQYGLSGWVLMNGTGSQNVPDGGSTALLLGFAISGLFFARRYMPSQPKPARAVRRI
jgi:hypothetical protein